MRRKKKYLILFFVLAIFFCLWAYEDRPEIERQTFLYSVKESDSLFLDVYKDRVGGQKKPLLLFASGGGFSSVEKDRKEYVDFFYFLVKKGFVVASIEYRTGLSGLKQSDEMNYSEMIVPLSHALDLAVEDYIDASAFVIAHTQEWGVDSAKIVACGSSAGAILVLQTEHYLSKYGAVREKLPDGFNYAGIIAFSGAVFSLKDEQLFQRNATPILMFHGADDAVVPCETIGSGDYVFSGSAAIAKQLEKAEYPYEFYKTEEAGHEIADTAYKKQRKEIMSFLTRFVLNRKK